MFGYNRKEAGEEKEEKEDKREEEEEKNGEVNEEKDSKVKERMAIAQVIGMAITRRKTTLTMIEKITMKMKI